MGKKILVIRFGSLGDIILTSAALLNLKINFPDAHITYLCKERFRPVAELLPAVDSIVTLSDGASAVEYSKLLLELDRQNFDTIVDLHGNLRSWAARKMITADRVVVYPKRRLDRLVAVKRKIIPKAWPHTIDLYNDAVEQTRGRVYCRRPVINPPDCDLTDELSPFVTRNPGYIVIAPGAAHPTKQWPVERFEQTATSLNRTEKVGIVWAITGDEAETTDFKAQIDSQSFVQLVDEPIGTLARVIKGASLTISNDSGVAHLSSAVGTPVLAIFGPTHPALGFSPRGLPDRVIDVDEFCRPCSLHGKKPCYREERYCFERIPVEMVCDMATATLKQAKDSTEAVFVDRDGTVIVDKDFLSNPDEIEFEQGALEALRRLRQAGYRIVIISNQSGVARGYFDTDTVDLVNARLLEMLAAENVEIDAVYYCPHHARGSVNEYSIDCNCRKPAAGMAEEAAYQLDIDLRNSIVIGDKMEDVNLGKVVGARAIIMVGTGYGSEQQDILKRAAFYSDVLTCENLARAADLIVAGRNKC